MVARILYLMAVTGLLSANAATADDLIVDDFESYTDELGSRIYETWIDGWDNGTGSMIGYLETICWGIPAEWIHSGMQAMPFTYDNTVSPWYSEVFRIWEEPQDWTRFGVDTLTLYLTGLNNGTNDPDQLYVALVDEAGRLKVVHHPDPLVVQTVLWKRWDIPLDEFTAAGVDVVRIKQMFIGVGDRDQPTPAGVGMIHLDDIRLTGPHMVEIDPNLIGWWNLEEDGGAVALDSSGYGNHGTLMGDPQWIPGYDGLALDLDGQGDYVETGKFPSELGLGGDAPRTVALWVYPRSFNGGGLYDMGGDGLRESFSLRTHDLYHRWQARYGGIDANFCGPAIDEWAHLAHVYEPNRTEIYVNAYYRDSRHLVLRTSDDKPFRIGTCAGVTFDGLIDDVRLYDRAMTWDEVRRIMYGSPLLASGPQPQDGVLTDIARALVLKWDAGALAVEHDVYLGTDEAEVREATVATEGVYRGRQPADATSYAVPEAPLQWNGTYYWRVDEIDADGAVTEGKVWRFQTADYLIIDDFESYDDEKHLIYGTWIDGWDNGTGSIVGYLESPFAEVPMPAHSGRQSMPFSYDNRNSPWCSEAFRTWETPQDWTQFGVDTLKMYFIGHPVPFVEREDGTIVMAGGGGPLDEDREDAHLAYRWLSGDGAIIARVDHVAETGPGTLAGVTIRKDLAGDAENAAVVVTASQGVVFQYRLEAEGAIERIARPGLGAPYWVRLVREGDVLTASCSADGVQWDPIGDRPGPSSVTIPMDGDVFIGLVVASDAWYYPTSAEFSSVSVTGAKGDSWETAGVGRGDYYGNDPDSLYVAVSDAAGNLAVMTHPDPLAVGAPLWERWTIPVQEIAAAGVDVTQIAQMTVGVGDRNDPVPSGEGMLHFDDFRLTRPDAAVEPNAVP
jgi:Concanavalin A-like lectin/glucanases superfamily